MVAKPVWIRNTEKRVLRIHKRTTKGISLYLEKTGIGWFALKGVMVLLVMPCAILK